MFGGPYPFGGLPPSAMTQEEMQEKQDDFVRYKRLKLFLSHALNLTDEGLALFARSVIANGDDSEDTEQQKYNYVITEQCEILVAVWNDSVGDLSQIGTGVACVSGPDPFSNPRPKIMINWAPEEPFGRVAATNPGRHSPCWLDAKAKKGILDAISKHFMLAQYPNGEIGEYREAWADARVAYAGEILVDLSTCTYIVTEDSGTYRPDGKYRLQVNEWFAERLHPVTGTLILPNPVPGCQPRR